MKKSNYRNTQVLIVIISGIFLLGAAILSSEHWFNLLFKESFESKKNTKIEVNRNKIRQSDTSVTSITAHPVVRLDKSETQVEQPTEHWNIAYGEWEIGFLPCHISTSSSPTGNQTFVWRRVDKRNLIISTEFIVEARGHDSRVGIVANTEGGLVEDDRKWCLIIDDGYLKLLEENVAHRAKVPFYMTFGERYKMLMFINGNSVKGKIWKAAENEPDWMVQDYFKGPYQNNGVGLQSEAAKTCFYEWRVE